MTADRNRAAPDPAPGRPPLHLLGARAMASLLLYLGASPLFLLPGAYLLPGMIWLSLLLPAIAVLLTLAAGLKPGKGRKRRFVLAIFAQVCPCAYALLPISLPAVLLLLPCLFLMLLLMPALSRAPGEEWRFSLLATGAAAHLAGQFLTGRAAFSSVAWVSSFFFSCYILLGLFVLNRYALMQGAGQEQPPPAGLVKRNRRLLMITSLIALPAANWGLLQNAAVTALHWLRGAAAWLLLLLGRLLPGLTPTEHGGEGQGFDPGMLGGETQAPSLLSQILEKLLLALASFAALALLAVGLYYLFKRLKKGLGTLLCRLRAYSRSIGEGYVDKTENLLHVSDMVRAVQERWELYRNARRRPPPWESLSARDKVRRVYALLIRRMAKEDASLTAREALVGGKVHVPAGPAQAMASLYEEARYSDHAIAPEDAEAMRKNAGV